MRFGLNRFTHARERGTVDIYQQRFPKVEKASHECFPTLRFGRWPAIANHRLAFLALYGTS